MKIYRFLSLGGVSAVLVYLKINNKGYQREISYDSWSTPPTIAKALDFLEQNKMITYEPGESPDGRVQKYYYLTPLGDKIATHLVEVEKILAGLKIAPS